MFLLPPQTFTTPLLDHHTPLKLFQNTRLYSRFKFDESNPSESNLNEDINPTKASHPGMSPSDLLLAKRMRCPFVGILSGGGDCVITRPCLSIFKGLVSSLSSISSSSHISLSSTLSPIFQNLLKSMSPSFPS